MEVLDTTIANARVVVIAGLSMLFALLRNEGGSVGTSIAKAIHDRREQFHSLLRVTGDPAAAE